MWKIKKITVNPNVVSATGIITNTTTKMIETLKLKHQRTFCTEEVSIPQRTNTEIHSQDNIENVLNGPKILERKTYHSWI